VKEFVIYPIMLGTH